jgi:hypothetical protein
MRCKQFTVHGGEEQKAQEIFKKLVSRNFPDHPKGIQIHNNAVRKLLADGHQTLSRVTSSNNQVGRKLRYAILRRGFDYYEEWY